VTHKVLNAKYHEQEAQIIAQAGRSGAITIATNMAGRGVDIMLGGNPEGIVDDVLKEWDLLPDAVTDEILEKAMQEARERCLKDRELVVALGGLAIIGTERHESRRIDNQLRGRSGRQGDPGQSRFYVSMQDELMRLFGPERFDFLLRSWDESEPIAAKMISNRIEVAQKKVESHNFESRQHVVKYDEVMKQQRKIVYEQRRLVLEGANIKESVINAIKLAVNKRVMKFVGDHPNKNEWDFRGLATSLLEIAPMLPLFFNDESMRYGPSNQLFADAHNQKIWDNYYTALESANSVTDLNSSIMDAMMDAYENHEQEHSEEHMRTLERLVTLRVIDEKWINHLDAMDFLRDGIQLRAYEQSDPLQAYSKEAYSLWLELLDDMQETIAHTILRVRLMVEEEEHRKAAQRKPLATNRGADEAPKRGDRVAHSKVGPNDPCPCGSGLKFKQCCKK
ncbi:MAG: SEC-C metal-binding domain-containing protein, partial [bacterium]